VRWPAYRALRRRHARCIVATARGVTRIFLSDRRSRVLDTFDSHAEARTSSRFRIVNGGRTLGTLFSER
jgi:hypothetical protein